MQKEIRELIGNNTLFLFNTQSQDPNFTYLADTPPGFEGNALFITKSTFLHLNKGMEHERAKKYSRARPKNVGSIFDYLKKNCSGKILINGRFLPFAAYAKLRKLGKVVDVSARLLEIRSIKTKEEVSRIRHAKKISLDAFKKTKLTGTETEIRRKLEFNFEPAYPSIVAADKNSSLPHYFPGNSTAKKLLLLDFGAR